MCSSNLKQEIDESLERWWPTNKTPFTGENEGAAEQYKPLSKELQTLFESRMRGFAEQVKSFGPALYRTELFSADKAINIFRERVDDALEEELKGGKDE